MLLVMVMVSLAGAVPFAAGSDHHRFDAVATAPAMSGPAGEELALDGPGQHEHRRGNEWAPTTTSRVRVVAPAVTTAHPRYEPASQPLPAGTYAAVPALPVPGELSQPGVLRV